MDIFISLLELTDSGIQEKVNTELNLQRPKHVFEGLEFSFIYYDSEYYQIDVHAYNTYTTCLLESSFLTVPHRIGGKYNIPLLVETSSGFAGVLCSYILLLSTRPIFKTEFFRMIGIDSNWIITKDTYDRLLDTIARGERKSSFEELGHFIDKDAHYSELTRIMVEHTKVYGEGYRSSLMPQKEGSVSFTENLCLLAAQDYAPCWKRVAVLNFANPVEPGGGILRGARAQEESICRSSNLYYSLTSKEAKPFYEELNSIMNKNQFHSMFLGSDHTIYSPGVSIFKRDIGYKPISLGYREEEVYLDQNFTIDVITCAAPFFSGSGYILPDGDLQYLFERRIRNIFEIAIENRVNVIVLGAFGCGAFHNPPDVVARAFQSVLLEQRYSCAFDRVVFALKRTAVPCDNIKAFEYYFSDFPKINEQGHETRWNVIS